MSNVGQAVLTIGGAGIGFLIGGPFGAQVGYLIGSGAGSLLFPTEINTKGPRLNDLTIQTSTIGAPIPIVYGSFALAGNVIWSGGLIEEVSEEEQGGKGGPTQTVTTYTYFIDCAVGICEGEIQGIRRIWADAKVIYDLSPQGDDESDDDYAARLAASQQTAELMTVYLGSETQLADPTIESYEPANSVPAFRGLAYVVFDQLPLADYGNRIPNFRFEVYTGTASAEDCTAYSNYRLEPWNDGATRDPRSSEGSYEYSGDGLVFRDSLSEALADAEEITGHPYVESLPWGWSLSSTPLEYAECSPISTESIHLYFWFNILGIPGHDCAGYSCESVVAEDGYGVVRHRIKDFVVVTEVGVPESFYFGGFSEPGSSDCGGGHFLHQFSDDPVIIRRKLQEPETCTGGTPIPGTSFCVMPDGSFQLGHTWTLTAGTFRALQEYTTSGPAGSVTHYPLNPVLPSTHEDYNDQAFWEAAYAQALADGEPIEEGLVYGVDYPVVMSSAFVGDCAADVIDLECVPIATVVADICARAGLTAVDVSDLSGLISGYCISRVMTARDALGPLRTVGLFDAVESGEELKFVERGGAAVDTVTENDLCAHAIDSERPPAVETTRIQEKELPRRVRLHYASQTRNYEPGEQSASRITTEAVTEQDVEVAVALCGGDEEGAQLSEILLYDAWVSRSTYRFALDNSWLRLEPTDCLIIPVDDQLERVRILSVDYSIGGILQIEAVKDDDGSYVSTAVPSEPSPSGNQSGGSSSVVCPSEIVLLDIPRLRAADIDAGYYAGVYGLCDTWTCAGVYRSGDEGDNYRRVGTTNTQATIGNVVDFEFETGGDTSDTSDTAELVLDYSFMLRIELDHGTLSTSTTAGLLSGLNTAAVGAHGRWEILQFLEATYDTNNVWELRGLARGQRGTEANSALVESGDRFVLLSGPGIFRIPEECSQRNITKLIKVPSCGESLAAVDSQEFSTIGLSCNTNVISDDDASPGDVPVFDPDTGEFVPGCIRLEQLCNVEFDSSSEFGDAVRFTGLDSDGIPVFSITDDPADTSVAIIDATIFTHQDETATLPNSLRLRADPPLYLDVDTGTNEAVLSVDTDDTSFGGGSGGGDVVEDYQAGDAQSTNNTTFINGPQVALGVGTWLIQMYIRSTSHATPDYNVRYDFSGTATGELFLVGNLSGGSTVFGVQHQLNNTSLAFNTTTNNAEHLIGTIEVTVAGDFTYQFRQSTNTPGTPITLRQGTYLRATKIV